jgi:hypothetical protein
LPPSYNSVAGNNNNNNNNKGMHTDVAIPADRNVVQKEAEKKLKYKGVGIEIRATNVEPKVYDYTSYNWSHWNSNETLKEKSGRYTRKTFDRFTTEDSYTWNITRNTETTAV